jgi:hypothetical protein
VLLDTLFQFGTGTAVEVVPEFGKELSAAKHRFRLSDS